MSLSVATGTFFIPSSGTTITVSGLGFQPAIVFFWTVGGANGSGGTFGSPITSDGVAPAPAISGFGCYDGTNQWCCSSGAGNHYPGAGTNGTYSGCQSNASSGTGYVIIGTNYSNSALDGNSTFAATSMNTGGFTLSRSGSSTPGVGQFQVHYLALGGTAVANAVAGSIILTSGSTSNQSVTGLGFTPNCLIGASVGRSTGNQGNLNFLNADWALSIGLCDGSLNQGVVANWASGEGSTTRTSYYNQHGQFYAVSSNGDSSTTNVLRNYGKIASVQSGGFTITPQAAASSAITLCYAALNITDALVGNFLTQTNTSNFSQTGFGFSPGAVLFLSSCEAESTANTLAATGPMSVGCATGSASQNVSAIQSTDNTTQSIVSGGVYFDSCYLNLASPGTVNTNPTVQGRMKLVSLDAGGFTTQMATADAQQNKVFYLAFGPGSASGPANSNQQMMTGIGT